MFFSCPNRGSGLVMKPRGLQDAMEAPVESLVQPLVESLQSPVQPRVKPLMESLQSPVQSPVQSLVQPLWGNYDEGHEQVQTDDQKEREKVQKRRREAHRSKEIDQVEEPEQSHEDCDDEDFDNSITFHADEHFQEKRKHKSTPFCWLCEYQGNRTTNEVIRFIMESIPHMALDSLITQSKYLLDRVDAGSNCSISQIKIHVTTHMLHPRVKLALQLQDMVKMQQDVAKCCVVDDIEAGGKTINPQAMRVYLTLCTQVTGVYKMGEEKLTFNQVSYDK